MDDIDSYESYYFKVIDKEGKCYGKKVNSDKYVPICDTYSTLLNNFLNSGGIISDTCYCVDSNLDDDYI